MDGEMSPSFRVSNKRDSLEGMKRKKVGCFDVNLIEGCRDADPSLPEGGLVMRNLRKFFENPPADEITSLNLSGVGVEGGLKDAHLSAEGKELLIRFAGFWWPKLTELKVDYFDHFLSSEDSFVNKLLSSPLLQRFHCYRIGYDDQGIEKASKDFPPRLFRLQHVLIDYLDLIDKDCVEFFKRLAGNPKLVSFALNSTELGTDFHFEAMREFIKKTCLCDHLDIIVYTKGMTKYNSISKSLSTDPMKLFKAFCAFAIAIVNSSATIRILGFSDWMFEWAKKLPTEEQRRGLFKLVEGAEFGMPIGLSKFPNLKRLETYIEQDKAADYVFPKSLQRLEMYGFPMHLVSTLVHLHLYEYEATFSEMLMSLMSLNGCSQLTTLELSWTIKDEDKASAASAAFCLSQAERRNPFRDLKTLKFTVYLNAKEGGANVPRRSVSDGRMESVVKILLSGFKLPELSLSHLALNCWRCPPGGEGMLGRNTLTRMIGGKLAESLERLEIEESAVDEDALPLLESLKAKVAENAKKLAGDEVEAGNSE